jgi:hypothetical protein
VLSALKSLDSTLALCILTVFRSGVACTFVGNCKEETYGLPSLFSTFASKRIEESLSMPVGVLSFGAFE